MKYKLLIITILGFLISCQNTYKKSEKKTALNLIPKPVSVQIEEGYFEFDSQTTFFVSDSLTSVAQIIHTPLREKIKEFRPINGHYREQIKGVFYQKDTTLTSEAYRLVVTSNRIDIWSSSYNGFVYATQTLRQLLPFEIESQVIENDIKWRIPCVRIEDAPSYQWRGLMLDVARHFFSKEYILKTLDRMAMFKLNRLHLHLIDNEGWRLEIKKYPKLTQVGAWRVNQEDKHWNKRQSNSPTEKGTYGGFYTQEDIREIVTYAQKLGIEVIPEIEMPAHTMSAIASYSYLSCHGRSIAVPSGGVWPITDIYCAGKETTFNFLEDVLDEVMALFPSKYIHIGGDEATHTEWEKCPYCKKRMKEHHLKDVHQLQSYFISRIENYLHKKGKALIGWDEIIEGGLPKRAIIMNWRGLDVVKKSIEKGHKVILTSDTYIDKYQGLVENEPLAIGGYLPLKKVYQYSLNEQELNEQERKMIWGSQANLWSEYISTEKHSEYMIFPRLLALSEIVWTPSLQKNWTDFSQRTLQFFPRLKAMDINFSKSIHQVTSQISSTSNAEIQIDLESETPDADIRYRLNQNPKIYRYTEPIRTKESIDLEAWVELPYQGPYDKVLQQKILFHKASSKTVKCFPEPHSSYQGQGTKTLTNIIRGTHNFHDKQWLGWLNQSPSIVVDLQEITSIDSIVVGVLQDQGSGIYLPERVEVFLSDDGITYKSQSVLTIVPENQGEAQLKDIKLKISTKSRYIKVVLHKPNLSKSNGGVWLFVDEIQVL